MPAWFQATAAGALGGRGTAFPANDAVLVAKLETAIAVLGRRGAGQENGFDVDICRKLLYVSHVVIVAE